MNIECVEDLLDVIEELYTKVHCYGEKVDLEKKLDEIHYEIKDLKINPSCNNCFYEMLVPKTEMDHSGPRGDEADED